MSEPKLRKRQDQSFRWIDLSIRTFEVWIKRIGHFVALMTIVALLHRGLLLILLDHLPEIMRVDLEIIAFDAVEFILDIWFDVIEHLRIFGYIDPAAISWFLASVFSLLVGVILASMLELMGAGYALELCRTGTAKWSESYLRARERVKTFLLTQICRWSTVSALLALPFGLYIFLIVSNLSQVFVVVFVPLLAIFCFALALYIMGRLSPLTSIVFAENHDVMGSIQRSFELTHGRFWHALIGHIVGPSIFAYLAATLYFYVLIWSEPSLGLWALVFDAVIAALITSPLQLVFVSVLYLDLRAEGPTWRGEPIVIGSREKGID
jgi:hypothetical protein